MGGYGIVGGNLPLAAGMALASDYRGHRRGHASACSATAPSNQGTFGETLNLAALWKLPVVFMVTNNQFGMGTALERHSAADRPAPRAARASACPACAATAWTSSTPTRSCARRSARAREERQPILVEAVTYRFRGHSMADPEEYRTKEQVAEWRKRDPITAFAERLARGRARRGRRRASSTRRRSRASTRRSRSPTRPPSRRPSRCTTTSTCSATRSRGWYSVDERSRRRAPRRGRARAAPRPSAGRRTPTTRRSRRRGREDVDEAPADERRRASAEEDERADGRHALPRGAQPGAARGDAARRARVPDGRGHRRLQRRLQGHRRACSRSSARSACATRRSPRTRSSAWASAPR